MSIFEHIHDRKPSGGRLREFLNWGFHAEQADKRYARTALIVWSSISALFAIVFLVINLV
jgi:hypothetical protein